jgi:serine/threonine protein kinase/Tfp pilus assembly protein PilF
MDSIDQMPVPPTQTLETPKQDLTTGSTFAGRYQIIEELGKGGMGKVFKVLDKEVNAKIALKLIKPEVASDKKTIERFRNELKTARDISHKNICRMYDLNKVEGSYYITMEYVSGEDLKSFIRRSKQLAIGTAISIAKQVCDGLEEAHSMGVVHRDLKPSNIMIDKDGNARIMDFGIARSLSTKGITGAGVMIGTPEYMSPEQAEAKDVDKLTDIYSFGVILHEMVTGQLPFEGDTPLAVALKHKSENPKDPKELNPQIPDDLSAIILKCLEKEKEDRFQSAEEIRSELERIEQGLPTSDRFVLKKKTLTSKEIKVAFGSKKLLIPALVVWTAMIVGLILWHPWTKNKSSVLSAVSDKPSIAVLPFEDLSPDKDQEPFCDGLAEALNKALSKVNNLYVRGKTSSFFFKGKEEDIQMIGDKLDVKFLLLGSLQKAGETLRVTASLINVSDDSVLWSEDYDGDIEDTFAFQDEIALSVVNELKVELLAGEKIALTKHPTNNIEALQLYQMGRFFRYKIRPAEVMFQAREYFEQAIEKDPEFSAAYAQLAETLMMLMGMGRLPWETWDETERKIRENVQKALDIDPFSSEAHSTHGVIIEVYDHDWEGAEREFKQAIELNPNDFGAHWEYALLLRRTNRFKKAKEECLKALEIDPLSTAAMGTLAGLYDLMGLEDKAEEVREKRKELRPPSKEGRNPIEVAEENIRNYGRNPQFLYDLGYCYAQSGNVTEAKKIIGELKDLYDLNRVNSTAWYIAAIYNIRGRKDEALDWLEKSCENGDFELMEIVTDDWMESVRSDPRFRTILVKLGLAVYLDF